MNSTHLHADRTSILSNPYHDWTLPLKQGPQDLGFDSSLMTITGIQAPPYAYFRDGVLETNNENLMFWEKGSYSTPLGTSIVEQMGEGVIKWNTAAYNMILVNETTSFLDQHFGQVSGTGVSRQPFFAYIALGSVHTPHSPPTKYLDGSTLAGYYPSDHLNALREMDMVVGSMIKLLEDRNVIEDTIIIFTSDNGGLVPSGSTKFSGQYGHSSSGHLRGSKGNIYEGGHRVPLIMRWDGILPQSERRSHVVGLNDVFATLCEFVGIKVPHGQAIDSNSFAEYLIDQNNQDNLRKALGVWRMFKREFQAESIRVGRLKLIRDRKDGNLQLYDLDADISESTNLILEKKYEAHIRFMLRKLIEIGPCYENNNSQFQIKDVDDVESTVNCSWFRFDKKRCDLYPEGRIYCKVSCGHQSIEKICHESLDNLNNTIFS